MQWCALTNYSQILTKMGSPSTAYVSWFPPTLTKILNFFCYQRLKKKKTLKTGTRIIVKIIVILIKIRSLT